MGIWGYYDDENDDSVMEFNRIIDEEIYDAIDPSSTMSYEILTIEKIRQFILEDKARTEKIFMKHINRIINDKTNADRYKNVIGVALILAKMIANEEIQCQPLQGIPPGFNLDFVINDKFPEKIIDIVINCIQGTIKEWNCKASCDDNSKRLIALNQELYLFSRGTLGLKGQVIPNNFQVLLNQN